MHRLCFLASLLIPSALSISLALAPSKTLSLPFPNSLPNTSLSVVPSGFRIQGVISLPTSEPLNDIAVYQNSVAAMEDLAFMDQSAELPSMPMRSWSLDQYDVSVDIISTSVKWAVYGLQMTERMISSSPVAFQPCVGKLFWQRHYEGRVRFLRRDTDPTSSLRARQAGMEDNLLWNCSSNTSLSEAAGGADNLLSTADPDIPPILNNNTISATSPPNTPQLEVVPTYNGLPMTAKDIFTIALSTMVLGAEQGPKTPCLGITGDAFDMVPLFDSHGQSLLKYHSLIRAMRLLTRWMAAMHRFGEVDIQLVRDEVVIGLGRLKRFGADEGGF